MNEIQAVKTAKIEEVKKNSKKGFTLVELVVVIAILAILAAIAIPVVSSTIKSSQKSSATSNAQTIELALKEAAAAISSNDTSVFTAATGKTMTLTQVMDAKKITSAVLSEYKIDGTTYRAYFDNTDKKVYYLDVSDTTKEISGKTLTGTHDLKSLTKDNSGTLAVNDFVVDSACKVDTAPASGSTGG